MTGDHIIVGVDPGKTGAIALLDPHGRLIDAYDMPVVDGRVSAPLLAGYEGWRSTPERFVAVIEDVHAMPGQGVTSMFSFGRSLGVAEAVFGTLGVRVEYVSPQRWKKALGLGRDKDDSRMQAIEHWPAEADLFARKKDNGRAEAALIALWYLKAHR
jgi:crossover junction endodeoxyribonuclease RuvC